MDALARSCSHLCHHSSKQRRCTPKLFVLDALTERKLIYHVVMMPNRIRLSILMPIRILPQLGNN
jgi:hypothetical protein